MSYTVPYSFVPGTKARAQEVNANFASILDSFDNIDSRKMDLDLSNITSAGIDVIKNNSSIRNLGELVISATPITDSGLHLLDGALLQGGGIYDDFVKYIKALYNAGTASNCFATESSWQSSVNTYGECGKFVYNATNNTVRLPKIKGFLEYTTNTSELGKLTQAGLPNITGSYSDSTSRIGKLTSRSGAITITTAHSINFGDGANSSEHVNSINFDASKSSPIYGRSSTVQPQSIKYLIYIVVGTIEKTDIQIDLDNVATDLNGKADKDGSNMNASVKNFDGQWVKVNQAIASDVNFNTGGSEIKTYSLASYLPDDNYTYEVLFTLGGQTAATSGASFSFCFISDLVTNVFVCRNIARSNAYVNAYGSAIVPLKTRQIKVDQVNNTSYTPTMTTLRICAYRRVGTNA